MPRIVTMRLLFAHLLCCLFLPVTSSNETCQPLCEGKSNCSRSISIGESCFFHFDVVEKSWNDTKEFCSHRNMTMVQLPRNANISFMNEVQKFAGKARGKQKDVWLGGKADDLGSWAFINGSKLNLTKVSPAKFRSPSNFHKCGVVNETLHLELSLCNAENPFICREEGRSQFHFARTSAKNWFEAIASCQERGGDLFYAKEGESVGMLLRKNVTSFRSNKKYFIGLRHQAWRWQGKMDHNYEDKQNLVLVKK